MKNFDVRYDRDIKEVKEGGTIVYKPRYDTKHSKIQATISDYQKALQGKNTKLQFQRRGSW